MKKKDLTRFAEKLREEKARLQTTLRRRSAKILKR